MKAIGFTVLSVLSVLVAVLAMAWLRAQPPALGAADPPLAAPSVTEHMVEQSRVALDREPAPARASAARAFVHGALVSSDPSQRRSSGPAPSASSLEARVANLEQLLAEQLHARSRGALVAELVAGGLAEADGERIVAAFARDVAGCVLEAVRLEALARSASFEEAVYSLEFVLAGGDVNPSDVLDASGLEQTALPCVLNAGQRAGIRIQ